jgi:hypothetical protein
MGRSPYVRDHSVNTIRLDAIPLEHSKDLDFAKARKLLSIPNHGVVRRTTYTIKYTSSLFCNIYLKPPFHVRQALRDVNRIRKTLNTCKKTPVTRFREIKQVNIQGNGNISDFQIANDQFWTIIDLSSFSDLEFECGTQYTSPATPISSLSKLVGNLFRYVHIKYDNGNVLRLNRNGSFTVIARTLDNYYQLLKILLKIVQTAKEWRT